VLAQIKDAPGLQQFQQQGSLERAAASLPPPPQASGAADARGSDVAQPPGWRAVRVAKRRAQLSLDFGSRLQPGSARGAVACLACRWRSVAAESASWIRKELALEQAPAGAGSGAGRRHRRRQHHRRWCRSSSPEPWFGFTSGANPSRAAWFRITTSRSTLVSQWERVDSTDQIVSQARAARKVSLRSFLAARVQIAPGLADERLGNLDLFDAVCDRQGGSDPAGWGPHQALAGPSSSPASARETPPCRRRRGAAFFREESVVARAINLFLTRAAVAVLDVKVAVMLASIVH